MIYAMRSVDGEVELECLNGGIGSALPRRVSTVGHKVTHELLAKRLQIRGHVIGVSCVYGNVNYGDRIPEDVADDELFDPSLVEYLFESNRDVLTLAGFASVLCDSRVLAVKRRS